MGLSKVVTGVFYLIAAFLVFNNASSFNSIIKSGGNFITGNIALLQGRGASGFSGSDSFDIKQYTQ